MFAEFQERVRRLANVLISLGVKRGQRVGTFGYNHYQHLELYFAIRTRFMMHALRHPGLTRSHPQRSLVPCCTR